MPLSCFVTGCSTHSMKEKGSFYRIPSIVNVTNKKFGGFGKENQVQEVMLVCQKRQQKWINIINRGELSDSELKNARICHKHFISGKPADLEDVDNPDWAPSLNLGYISNSPIDLVRRSRSLKRSSSSPERFENERRRKLEETIQNSEKDIIVADVLNVPSGDERFETNYANSTSDKSTQTDMSIKDLTYLFEKLSISDFTIEALQIKINKIMLSEEEFQNDDCKTKYFTGLDNSKVLFLIHDLISSHLYCTSNTALSTFQQLLLTLMTLRLNLDFKYLSYRFGVALRTVSKYFRRCLHVLFCMLKTLIVWPDRDTLCATMPQCFYENFGNQIAVIIDCFEVFIESPRNLYAGAQCWSNYKHHKTVKVLIGITPQGSVCFISDAWGGRVSDKYITNNSGFLDHLIPGDVVLADRGFLIEDEVKMSGADVKIPCFTKGKSQLHPRELEETRNVAHVRIHVERVIGSIRQKFKILTGIVPISMLRVEKNGISMFDEIVLVCSGLVNVCTSMVS